MSQIYKKIKTHIYELLLGIFTLTYIAYFTTASIFKYNNFYSGRFDLGNMAQTVWNTAHGRLFLMTDPNGTREVSRLAFHADFILAALAPFYWIWEDPRTLLVIQTLVMSVGGIFVYLIAKEILKNKLLSLIFALTYFLNPAVNYVNLFDFHSVSLAITFMLGAFYFILKKKYWITIIFLILAALTKEEIWLINAIFGLYFIFIEKKKILGSVVTLISLLMFYILIWIAIPRAHGGAHFALSFYSDYGDSPGTVIKNIFLNPVKTLGTLLLPDRLSYVKQLFMPLGYISFIGLPFLIFAAPDLGINLLSNNGALHQIYYQYSSGITPFIFISAIYAVSFMRRKLPEIPMAVFCVFLLSTALLSAYAYGPLPFARKPQNQMFTSPVPNREFIDSYINQIPQSYTISATNNLGSHLSHRRNIYVMPRGIDKSDLVMYLLRNSNQGEKNSFQKISNDPQYQLVVKKDTFYVFKKI
jgi:uncharacterized membrane protein